MSKRFYIFIGVLTVAIFGLNYLAVEAKKEVSAECAAKGGKLVETDTTFICVKKDAFL